LRFHLGAAYGSRVTSLDLALVGNGTIGALIDARGAVAWCCFPRFDGDPVFCSLLAGDTPGSPPGTFAIELEGVDRIEQEYVSETPILVTRMFDAAGNAIEVTDFCPRYEASEDLLCPAALVREIRPIAGRPTVRVALRPALDYGCRMRTPTPDGNQITYSGEPALRLATDAPLQSIIDATPFPLDDVVTLVFGVDDGAPADPREAAPLLTKTRRAWMVWRQKLQPPSEWRDAVIRAAITLELNAYVPTGAIVPAVTTSIPEAPNTGRNWDYRYCWPRDAYFTAAALGRLNAFPAVERYLQFLFRIADSTDDGRLVPIYDVDGGEIPPERVARCLGGYRGMGPVRIGNKASEQAQHDLYGEAVLTAESLLGAEPPSSVAGDGRGVHLAMFERLESFGEHAARLYDKPDAGLWELRGAKRVHTFSSLMCWAACQRLSIYAQRLRLKSRANFWWERAAGIHHVISERCWNAKLNAFTATMDGDTLDASLLLMPRLGFLAADHPRFVGTVEAIERQLKHGDFIYRYIERDDFGYPENAFLVCTFWYIEALAQMGDARRGQARALFEKVLSARNRHGLLAEDLDTQTLEQWGNFPQTYCMAGIIDCALALAQA
jgi:GH15 family glucan-1,4-alpha-glucosidase